MPVLQQKHIDLPGAVPRLESAELLNAYATMVRIRRFEEKAAQLYAIGEIENLPGLSIGHEAVLTAAVACVSAPGQVAALLPISGLDVAQGASSALVMGKLVNPGVGRNDASSTAAEIIILEPSSNADERSAQLQAAKANRRAVVYITLNTETDVSAALNLRADQSQLCQQASTLGLKASVADGVDIEQLSHVIDNALASARATSEPVVIEAMLHRYRGHGRGSQGTARPSLPREVIDPLARTRQILISTGAASAETLSMLESDIRESIAAGVAEVRGQVAAAVNKT